MQIESMTYCPEARITGRTEDARHSTTVLETRGAPSCQVESCSHLAVQCYFRPQKSKVEQNFTHFENL